MNPCASWCREPASYLWGSSVVRGKSGAMRSCRGTEVLQRRELFASLCWSWRRRKWACPGPICLLFLRLVGVLLVRCRYILNLRLIKFYRPFMLCVKREHWAQLLFWTALIMKPQANKDGKLQRKKLLLEKVSLRQGCVSVWALCTQASPLGHHQCWRKRQHSWTRSCSHVWRAHLWPGLTEGGKMWNAGKALQSFAFCLWIFFFLWLGKSYLSRGRR